MVPYQGPASSFPDPRNDAAVNAAWEAFLAGSSPSAAAPRMLREVVDTSWQRCLMAHVDPHAPAGPHPVDATVLRQLREVQRELMEASTPVMACARDFLAETGTMMALADARATILSFEGDVRTKLRADDIRLVPGVNWSEFHAGTNAIGTALAVGQPVQIHSAEHFVEGIKRWTCSATVVRHPLDGEILGVLDVSGLSESYSRQSLALVVTTANRIESRLVATETERRYRLLDAVMASWMAAAGTGAVLFDRRGVPIKVNEHAHRALLDAGAPPGWLNARRVRELTIGRNGPLGLPPWLSSDWLHLVASDNETLGTLLVLPGIRRRGGPRAAVQSPPPVASPACAIDGQGSGLVFEHSSMRTLVTRTQGMAAAPTPVLIHGETGTGKEAIARSLHGTRSGAYVALNCGGLARELLASELFGYVEGAFTGARRGGMTGKIEAAEGGTLFLDEIGELPLDMQPLLLRVLEQGEIYRLGENTPRKVNFRLVTATHRDLRADVAAGRFRMDLYYRIAVASLVIPPLRERGGDVLLLAQYYLRRFSHEAGLQPLPALAPEAREAMLRYAWPGNVRELRNVLEAAVWASGGQVITVDLLPSELRETSLAPSEADANAASDAPLTIPGTPSLQEAEAALIQRTVQSAGGNLTRAAQALHIAKSTLYAKMHQYGLRR